MNNQSISVIVAITSFLLLTILVIANKDILKESDNGNIGKYSFSKFQLWLWTLVICPAFALHWGFCEKINLNEACLILLGIVSASRLTSTIVTDTLKNNNEYIHLKINNPSKSFWKDILSDDSNNLSIIRLQNLIFTLTYIVIFVVQFFKFNMDYPVFESTSYMLMGISSGGYLIGKGLRK